MTDIETHPQRPGQIFFATTTYFADRKASRIGVASTGETKSQQIVSRPVGSHTLTLAPDGNRLVVGFDDGHVFTIALTATTDGHAAFAPRRLVAHASAINDVEFDETTGNLFTASADSTVKAWTPSELSQASSQQEVIPEQIFTAALTWLADGRIVSSQASDQPVLRLWDRKNGGRPLQSCPVPQRQAVTDFCPVSDRHVFFVAYAWPNNEGPASVGVWDLRDNTTRLIYRSAGETSHLAVTPDKQQLIAGVGDEVVVLDVSTQAVSYRRRSPTRLSHTTHPFLNLCASGARSPSEKPVVEIWDVDEHQTVTTLPCSFPIKSLAFSPDGKQLVAGTDSGPLLLWTDWREADDAEPKQTPRTLVGHGMYVRDVEFSPDSKRIVSASLDGTVRLWNAVTGNELLRILSQAEWNYAATFDVGGKALAFAGGKGSPFGSIRILDVNEGSR